MSKEHEHEHERNDDGESDGCRAGWVKWRICLAEKRRVLWAGWGVV